MLQLCMGFRLGYMHLTLAHSNGQGQGHGYFNCKYHVNGKRWGKHYYYHQIERPALAFDLHFRLTLAHSKVQGQGRVYFHG